MPDPDRLDPAGASDLVGAIDPGGAFASLFAPVHGSANDIAGQGLADPTGQTWSAAMGLDRPGEAAADIPRGVERVLSDPRTRTRGDADVAALGGG